MGDAKLSRGWDPIPAKNAVDDAGPGRGIAHRSIERGFAPNLA